MSDFPPSDVVQLGGHVSRLSVSVRVASETLDPEAITRLMRVEPKFAAKKGAKRESGGRTVTQRIGIWTYGLTENSSSEWELDDAIVALLNRLPDDLNIWRDLARTHQMDVFCGLFMGSDNQGTVLQSETLRSLANRGLSLDLDIYGPPPDDV